MKNTLAPRRVMMTTSPTQILRPVVGLDIDGSMGDYHEHFLAYAAQFLQRPLPGTWDGSVPFWQACGVSKAVYREMKLGYRQGRMKRSMPVRPGAALLAQHVRANGAETWVCTTRPWLRLDNIDPDTQWWLKHNDIRYDGVLYGDSKYRDLRKLVGSSRVVAVLDDEPDQVRKALELGLPAFIIDRKYNQHERELPRFENLSEARIEITALIRKWKKEQGL